MITYAKNDRAGDDYLTRVTLHRTSSNTAAGRPLMMMYRPLMTTEGAALMPRARQAAASTSTATSAA